MNKGLSPQTMGLSGTGWGGSVERPQERDWPELWAHKGQCVPWLCPGPQTETGGLGCGGGQDLALV